MVPSEVEMQREVESMRKEIDVLRAALFAKDVQLWALAAAGAVMPPRPLLDTYPESICRASAAGDLPWLREALCAGTDLSQGDYDQRTAMHLAACEGHLSLIEFLVDEAGVDVNPRDYTVARARD